jgi:hypothetical protein
VKISDALRDDWPRDDSGRQVTVIIVVLRDGVPVDRLRTDDQEKADEWCAAKGYAAPDCQFDVLLPSDEMEAQ